MTTRSAVVAGASGLVGSQVVTLLSGKVVRLGRSDYESLDAHLEGATEVYACLGTTMKKAGSEEAFRAVDYGLTLAVAKAARAAGATRFALVSSVGASPNASNFYYRVKGETERDVEALGFERLVIVRPSFLLGARSESRPGETAGILATRALSFALVGGWRKYRAIDAKVVAAAMVAAMSAPDAPAKRVLEHDDIVTASGS